MSRAARAIGALSAYARVVLVVVIGALAENWRGLLVLGGAVWLYVGLYGVSPHAADVVAGVTLMAIGAWPYLQRPRRP